MLDLRSYKECLDTSMYDMQTNITELSENFILNKTWSNLPSEKNWIIDYDEMKAEAIKDTRKLIYYVTMGDETNLCHDGNVTSHFPDVSIVNATSL